jgi:hypothetical protein
MIYRSVQCSEVLLGKQQNLYSFIERKTVDLNEYQTKKVCNITNNIYVKFIYSKPGNKNKWNFIPSPHTPLCFVS